MELLQYKQGCARIQPLQPLNPRKDPDTHEQHYNLQREQLTFQGNSKDYAEGFWTSKDTIEEYAPQLVEGFKFLSGETWYYKNKK